MKRFLSFVLAMAMFVSCVQWGALPLTAWGTSDTSATYTDASGTVWVDFESVLVGANWLGGFYNVPAGNYYLSSDCALDRGLIVKADVTLDLNDHILTIDVDQAWADDNTVADAGIVIYGGNLTLVDNNATTARYWDTETGEIQTNASGITGTNAFVGGAITGGYNSRAVLGGGAICIQSGSLTMTNANLVGNATSTTGILGGAVYVNANATFTMNSGSIIGNTSGGLAGAVYVQCNGTFTMNAGTIAHNSTGTTANYAGAVYNVGTFTMNGGVIDSNESMGGGAVSTVAGWKAGSGVFTMNGGSITNNYAATAGGAVLIGSGGTFVMNSGSISGNNTSGAGGAINLLYENSTVSIYGGSITNNTATGLAGGIRVNGGTLHIGQTGSTPITIYDNTVNGAQNNVCLFGGSTIMQVGGLDGTCSVGVTLESGMGTAAVGSGYAITAADTTYYSSDAGYYRILDGDSVILLEAGVIPGTDAAVEYEGTTIDITTLGMFDLTARHGTASYTLADTGTGTGSLTSDGVLTVTQIGTFDILIGTSYTTTAEPKTGSATLTVKAASVVSVAWPVVEDEVAYNETQAAHATLVGGSASITPDGGDTVTVDGTFSWVSPSEASQDAGAYTGTVIFTPDAKYNGAYDKYFTALTGEVDYTVGEPPAPIALTGTDVLQTYGADAIDITTLGLFVDDATAAVLEAATEAGVDITYTITPVTGEGVISGTSLDVSKVGTFTVTVTVGAMGDAAPTGYVGSATLTVTPILVDITGLIAEDRGPYAGDYSVTLTEAESNGAQIGSIVASGSAAAGIVAGDDVTIVYDNYVAAIDNQNYADASYYTGTGTTGEATFAVTVTGLTLAGENAANYTLVTIAPTTVTVKMSIPYIAWPTATNITYGQTQGDSTLNGGMVVVLGTDGNYTEIEGDFQWVSPTDEMQGTGTHTGTVQFVETGADASADDTYQSILSTATRDIDYLIEAAAVTFTLANNSVAYGSYVNPTVTVVSSGTAPAPTASDYTVTYLQLVDGVYKTVTSPTEVGTYFIGIGFHSTGTDANGTLLYPYYHTGTSVSTAKQIGVLVIYDYQETYLSDGTIEVSASEPATYSLSFTDYTGATDDFTQYDLTDVLPQTIHILPTLDSTVYSGWADAYGTIYAFGSRYAQPEYDMTFTAVLAVDSYTISGTVTGAADLTGNADAALSNVSVVLMSGNDQIATTTTDANGNYSFHVAAGRYTVEFTLDYGSTKYIESVFADATSANRTVDMYFPSGRYNVELNLASGMDGITVDGLQELLDELSYHKIVENSVAFGIHQVDVDSSEYALIISNAKEDGLTEDNIKLFYDVQITEEVTLGTTTDVASVSEMFAIYIPLAGMYQAKENYVVYRNNDGAIDKLTTIANADGEYIELIDDGQTIVIYAKASALYAISFTEPALATLAGTDVAQVYGSATIDVSTLGMFEVDGLGTATYTITEGTGSGTIVGNLVKVSHVGTFTVTVNVAATATTAAMQGTATLTITPAELNVYDLVGVSRGAAADDDYVELDADASYTLTGLVYGDDVSLLYDDAYGRIVTANYISTSYYTDDSATFAIVAGGLALTGDDQDNYTLAVTKGTVEISIATPYMAWPAATDITYGQDLSASALYGGKVIVYDPEYVNDDNTKGAYVTLAGTFEWLNTTEWLKETTSASGSTSLSTTSAEVKTTGIGSYQQYVTFTPDDVYEGAYDYLFTDVYHAVDVVIKATAVQFTISDNDVAWDGNAQYATVTATASVADTLSESDYVIQYYQFGDDGIEYITNPTDVGTYLMAAYFTSTNFHHTGTLESTGKQIGVLYIREDGSTATATYGVTFVGVDGAEYQDFAITDALQETIHILPTITDTDAYGNAAYVGWEYNDSVYDFGARFGQPASDAVFTAVAAPDSYAVSGTVYGQDLTGDDYNVPLDQVGVAIMQGSETIATTVTDAQGSFTVYLPAGEYTVVITRDQVVENEVSIHFEVVDKDITLDDIDLPDVAQNTVLEIASGVVVTSVDGLSDVLSFYTSKDEAVSHTITVEVNPIDIVNEDAQKTEYDEIMDEAAEYGITTDQLKLFFDVSIWHTSGGVSTQITTIPDAVNADGETEDGYLEIYITLPGTYQGEYTYQVYRYHTYESGTWQVDLLTTDANDDGEKIEVIDEQTLKITAKYYSVYGIAYLPIEEDDDGKTEDDPAGDDPADDPADDPTDDPADDPADDPDDDPADDPDDDTTDDDPDDDDTTDDTDDDTSGSSGGSVTVTVTTTDAPTSPATGETGVIAHIVEWYAQVFA